MDADRATGTSGLPGEFELIERLARTLSTTAPGRSGDADPLPELVLGIGDDCAALRRGSRTDVYTTDTLVDGVHFRAGEISWADLGWKAIAVNLSDIAAMGARPLASLVTLGLPGDTDPRRLDEMYRGMAAATSEYGGAVIGGDIVRSPVLFITVAMSGEAAANADGEVALLRRDAAQPGDRVAVTGTLGDSGGGLQALRAGLSGAAVDRLAKAHHRPRPRVRQGRLLVSRGVRAAMDVSDGLVDDLGKLCAASGTAAVVRSDRLPASDELRDTFPDEWLSLALGGGEDYELLFTAPPQLMESVVTALEMPATVIGEIVAGDGDDAGRRVAVIDADGRPVEVARGGWDHLRD